MSNESFECLMGGRALVVTLKNNERVEVFVRELPIGEYPELLRRMEDEEGQVELYCQVRKPKAEEGTTEHTEHTETADGRERVGVPKGWARLLTAAGHDLVMETAEELNRDFFGRWLRRRMGKMELVRPGATEELFGAAKEAAGIRGGQGSQGSHEGAQRTQRRD